MSTKGRRAGLFGPGADEQARREEREDREAEYRAAIRRNEERAMKEFETRYGDKVAEPPNTKAVRAEVDALFESAARVLDEVAEAARRDGAINQSSPVDVGRFPATRGGGGQ